ncbi:MAG: hypothetical protein MR983_00690 [Succinatimonas sp.]|nr:hypothetical protein [Succinatimonas sp.]
MSNRARLNMPHDKKVPAIMLVVLALVVVVFSMSLNAMIKSKQQDAVLFFSMDDQIPKGFDALTAATDLNFNTNTVAQAIKDKLGAATLIRLETSHKYPADGQILGDAFEKLRAQKADLHFKNEDFTLQYYKRVFIGFPVWRNRAPIEIDNFLKRHKAELENKEINLFVTSTNVDTDKFLSDFYKEFPQITFNKVLSVKTNEESKFNSMLAQFLVGK